MTTLVHHLRANGRRCGLATLYVGVGEVRAVVVERFNGRPKEQR